MPIHTPSRRHQRFFHFLCKNKLLTGDNLNKRIRVDDLTCLFCANPESVHDLLFDCCVLANVWQLCSKLLGVHLNNNFESVASTWLSQKRHLITNMCSSAAPWAIWKLRNALCFHG
jgi:hypothetical protein